MRFSKGIYIRGLLVEMPFLALLVLKGSTASGAAVTMTLGCFKNPLISFHPTLTTDMLILSRPFFFFMWEPDRTGFKY